MRIKEDNVNGTITMSEEIFEDIMGMIVRISDALVDINNKITTMKADLDKISKESEMKGGDQDV